MGASVREIAKKAGVSVGTVSRIINGAKNIDPAIQERAILAMRELNYVPASRKRRAEAENSLRSWNIGILYYGSPAMFAGNAMTNLSIAAIEGACKKAGYQTILELVSPTGGFETPKCVADGKVDGVLFENPDKARGDVFRISALLPAVAFNSYYPGLNVPQVCPDDFGSACVMLEEIMKRGHKRIAFLNAATKHYAFKTRRRAFIETLEGAGLFSPELLVEEDIVNDANPSNLEPPDVSRLAARLLALKPRPTAVMAANDWMAAGLYKELKARGLEPGRDISVTGFDNVNSVASLLDPPLATMEIAFREIAEAAAETLIRLVDGGERRSSITMFQGRFVARPSLARAKEAV